MNLIFTHSYLNPPPAPPYADKKHRDKEGSSRIFSLIAGMKSPFEVPKAFGRFIGWGMFVATFMLVFFPPSLSKAQESFERTITKTAQFTNPQNARNKFQVLNINGSVTVEAYNGDTVKLTINKHFEGADEEIERAKEELTFKLEKNGNTIYAYLEAPFAGVDFDDGDAEYDFVHIDDDVDYEFSFDIHALVPNNILIDASTMNDGSVGVIGSFKKIKAHNLNGDVKLKSISSKVIAKTLNGDVDVVFTTQPPADSKFKTLNGDIDVTVPESLSADIYFESLTGDFYTNLENFKRLSEDGEEQNGLVKYIVGSFTPIRIGDGEVELRFKVLNGDVYLRKK